MSLSVLLVVNPAARSARAALPRALAALAAAGARVTVLETMAPGDAGARIPAMVVGTDRVVALGGDGTVMEIATALRVLDGAPALGVIPLGTANVLARSLGIPLHLESAMAVALHGRPLQMDLGVVTDGPCFAIGLGLGLDVRMVGRAPAWRKRRLGYWAYVWSAFWAGVRLERFTVRATVDGVPVTARVSSALVANMGRVLNDRLTFGQCVTHTDGQLDLCLYAPRHHLDALRIGWRMLRGTVGGDRCVQILTGGHITLETDAPRGAQCDGDLVGSTPLSVTVAPGALIIMTSP